MATHSILCFVLRDVEFIAVCGKDHVACTVGEYSVRMCCRIYKELIELFHSGLSWIGLLCSN